MRLLFEGRGDCFYGFLYRLLKKHAHDSKETGINVRQTNLEHFVDEILHILVMENIYMTRRLFRFLSIAYLFT